MKTAAGYRAMADECFKWAREAQGTASTPSPQGRAANSVDGYAKARKASDQ